MSLIALMKPLGEFAYMLYVPVSSAESLTGVKYFLSVYAKNVVN